VRTNGAARQSGRPTTITAHMYLSVCCAHAAVDSVHQARAHAPTLAHAHHVHKCTPALRVAAAQSALNPAPPVSSYSPSASVRVVGEAPACPPATPHATRHSAMMEGIANDALSLTQQNQRRTPPRHRSTQDHGINVHTSTASTWYDTNPLVRARD
jgi:hypothetical protein